VQLTHRERKQHLHTAHGFIEVGPSMLPRKQAFARLWDRVFQEGDQQAHQQLMELCSHEAANNGASYSQALAAEIMRRGDLDESRSQGQTAWKRWEPWLACVRAALPSQPVLRHLLLADSERAREVGRALVLPQLGEKLRGDRVDAAQFRRAIEEVFPGHELLEERIRLCGQLPQVGVDQAKASACQALFEQERPIPCPECPARVPGKHLEIHLRRAHGIFQFRGVRRGYNETRDALLEAVCGPRPDVLAWQALEGLAQDRHGDQATQRLVVWINHTLKRSEKEARGDAVASAGEAIARAGSGLGLLPHLLGEDVDPSWKNVARHLALAVVAHLDTPPSAEVLQQIKPYLAAKLLPQEVRQSAAAGLLRTFGDDSPVAKEVLQAYVSVTNKVRAVERLHALEAVVGQAPAIEELVSALEDRIRMTCPRCNEQLERRDMVKHLWDRHHLLLEGRRVREPWRVLADWVVDYRLEKDPQLLQRCQALAQQADPEEGTLRLQRLMLRQGIEDPEAWNALVTRARQRKASLCPSCYAQVPLPLSPAPAPLMAAGRRLEGAGYLLELHEAGLTPRLTIEAPAGVLYDAGSPDALLTRNGALTLIVVPAMALCGFLLYVLTPLPWTLIAALALGLGFVLAGLTMLVFPTQGKRGRLVDLAWTALVPSLLEQPLDETSGRFLESLAEISRTQGSREGRREVVEELVESLKGAAQRPAVIWPVLAALWRLQMADLQASGEDPVPALVDLMEQVLRGDVPARALGPVLEEIKESWPRGRLARVQAIVIARAAELGLEIADIADLVRTQPALAPLLGAGDLDHLTQLRLFWRLRASWPRWLERADSVFDLARSGAEKTLGDRPDLLLLVHKAPIYVGSRGVWIKDVCIGDMPAKLDVAAARHAGGEGFEIVAGRHRIWFSAKPNEIADELDDWLRFYFRDFLPQVAAEHARPSGAAGAKLRRANAAACPECKQPVMPILGEIGLRAE
jgi:hypothetical protein